MDNKEFHMLRKDYYSIDIVKQALLKASYEREVSFTDREKQEYCIRLLRFGDKKGIDWLFYFYDFFTERGYFKGDYNLYVSNAIYRFIPAFDYNLKVRSKETNYFFKNHMPKYVKDFDLLMDFDFVEGKWAELKTEVFDFCTLLDMYKIAYIVYPSGSGFQVIIYGSQIDSENKKKFFSPVLTISNNVGISYNYIIDELKEQLRNNLGLKFLCKSNIKRLPQLRKMEFSLVGNRIIIPFRSIESIKDFKYTYVTYDIHSHNLFDSVISEILDYGYIHNKQNISDVSNFKKFLKDNGVKQ